MGINTLAPQGFQPSRYLRGQAPTFQARKYKIAQAYATKIAIGDPVQSVNTGYIQACPNAPVAILGVLAWVDLTTLGGAATSANLLANQNAAWLGAAMNAQQDVDAYVYDDPDMIFRVQVTGGPWAQNWRGRNIQLLANSQSNPNAAGISQASVDGTSTAVTATLPFRVLEVVGVSGVPNSDPANTNPWIEVSINYGVAELVGAAGTLGQGI